MTDQPTTPANVLRYWRSVELLSPQDIPAVSPRNSVWHVPAGSTLPWAADDRRSADEPPGTRSWRHAVFLGLFSLDDARELVEERLGRDRLTPDRGSAGQSALAVLETDARGRLIPGSVVLSGCAWATAQIHAGGIDALDGFPAVQRRLAAAMESVLDDEPLDRLALDRCLTLAQDATGIAGLLDVGGMRIRRTSVKAGVAGDPGAHDFLNSFHAADLGRIADAYGAGGAGAALRAYLTGEGEAARRPRIDVQRQLTQVLAATRPAAVPAGRWPTAADRPLALGQQLAVNDALAMAAERSPALTGVNGPPGTGKTTMLRDVIAAVMVERARRLSALAHPRDAFTGATGGWRTDGYPRTVHHWRPELTGFEMVVASANNGAVDNVTRDIPGRDAIDASWQDAAGEVDPLAGIATSLLGSPAWSLVSAPLGKRQHTTAFVERCWWTPGRDPSTPKGLQDRLKELERQRPSRTAWSDAVTAFRRAADREETLRARRVAAYDAHLSLVPAREAVATAEAAATDLAAAAGDAASAARAAEQRLRKALTSAERRRAAAAELAATKPGFFERLLTLGRATRDWRERYVAAADSAMDADAHAAAAEDDHERATTAAAAASRAAAAAWADARQRRHEADQLEATLRTARAELGDRFPDGAWQTPEAEARRATATLWTDAAWNTARTELFLAAITLHREVLRHVPTEMRKSLHGAIDLLEGRGHDATEADARAAWHALFFIVPVVSTTFASLPRLFRHLGAESIGWMLIDEAGQASPQSAAGALWRARRALVVGDPLQLEPITRLSESAELALARAHRVDPEWAPRGLSAQRLADRVTRHGTMLPYGDAKLWVGAPLTVHRRCDEPMFGFVNEVAYGGLMIHATSEEAAAAFDARHRLPPACWIDVRGTASDGHWLPEEGVALDRLLALLDADDVDMKQVLVLSPFRDVARRLERRCDVHEGLRGGTIHTAQGREADVVVLVLGGAPGNDGVKEWAARKPNLVNVAASRARRRLYVIGNRHAWERWRHFDVLADHLPAGDPCGALPGGR